MSTPITIGPDAARDLRGAVRFGRESSHEARNHTPTPAVGGSTAPQTVSWPVKVTGSEIASDGSDAGLYPGEAYVPGFRAGAPGTTDADLWETHACYLRALPDHTLAPGDTGLGRMIGWRGDGEGGKPVYVVTPGGSPGPKGEHGAPGRDGRDGERGRTGPPGRKGDRGARGPMMLARDGHDGRNGVPGPRGARAAASWKDPVLVATMTSVTLSSLVPGYSLNGVTLQAGDRVLVNAQSSAAENGIYAINTSGAPVRTIDALTGADLLGATVAVLRGTAGADTVWLCTADPTITVGSTALPWVQIGPSPGAATHWLEPCVVATTGNITLAGAQTIDGVSVVAGNRVLVRAQSASQFNGIYVCASGGWSRATDCDTTAELSGAAVVVTGGTTFPNSVWALNGAIGLSFSGTLIGPYMLATQINAASTAFALNDSMYASSIRARPQGGIRLGYLGSLASNTLYMEVFEASATQNGMITTGTQTLAANKTFLGGDIYVGNGAFVSGQFQISESNRNLVVAGPTYTTGVTFLGGLGASGGVGLYGRVPFALGAIVFNGSGWGGSGFDTWADYYGMHFVAAGAGPTQGQLRLGRYMYHVVADAVTGTFYSGLDASVNIGGLIYKFRKGILTEITPP